MTEIKREIFSTDNIRIKKAHTYDIFFTFWVYPSDVHFMQLEKIELKLFYLYTEPLTIFVFVFESLYIGSKGP